MKINNETKIGILVTAAIIMFILGFNFLRGKGFFSTDKEYHSFYENIQGLQVSAEVMMQGYAIGKVSDIALQADRKIKVTFLLHKEIKVPEGATVQLETKDFVSGTKFINLTLPENINENTKYLPEYSLVPSTMSSGLLDNISDQVSPLMSVVRNAVSSLDSILHSINTIINDDAREHLNNSFAALDKSMKELSELSAVLNKQSSNLTSVIQNANSITGNLASSNEHISNTLGNLSDFSNQLKNTPLDQTLKELNGAVTNINGIVSKINSNEGSLGLIMSDPVLYHNLTGTLGALDTLLTDLKERPSRYINVSVFGRKHSKD